MKNLLFILFVSSILYAQQHKIDTLNIEDYQINSIKLPKILHEISGLEYDNGFFWGFNDSGGQPTLYKFTANKGNIVQAVTLSNAKNIDWEDITSSNDYIFIGDFGNNYGTRKDLSIYYINKNNLNNKENINVKAKKIDFYYPEQKSFIKANRVTNFDTEAMIYYKGKIHLFTKEWSNLKTTHYTLEIKEGKQAAKKIESFTTNYLVTGASLNTHPNTSGLYLTGYTKEGIVFISGFSLPSKESNEFFNNKTKKFNLPVGFSFQVGQVEGISIKEEEINTICISAENFKYKSFHVEQSLHCINSYVN